MLMTVLSMSPKMTVTSNGHNLRGHGAIKKTSKAAVDDLMKQVVLEKKVREEKKKKRQAEKKAEEELAKEKKAEEEHAKAQREVTLACPVSCEDHNRDLSPLGHGGKVRPAPQDQPPL